MDPNRSRNDGFSLKEAAALADMSERALRNEVERGVVRPGRRGRGAGRSLRFRADAILYLMVVRELPFSLTRRDRVGLYELIAGGARRRTDWVVEGRSYRKGIVRLDSTAPRRRLTERLRAYRRGLARIHEVPEILGGETVFMGTRIPVRHVGRLAQRGIGTEELLSDFPMLTAEDVEFARIFAGMKPAPGRPRKRLYFHAERA